MARALIAVAYILDIDNISACFYSDDLEKDLLHKRDGAIAVKKYLARFQILWWQ
jgi:hypothetical protein